METSMDYSNLNIFSQTKPIQAVMYLKNGQKIKLFGFAVLRESHFLQINFPISIWPNDVVIDWQKNIFIYLEEKNTVISVSGSLEKDLEPGNLLVKPFGYVNYIDRRDSLRVTANNIQAYYQPVNENGSPLCLEKKKAKAENISSTGIVLQAFEIITPDQRLYLEIILPEEEEKTEIMCIGRVTRLALQTDGNLEVALCFEDIQQQDQEYLFDFCYSHRLSH